MGFDLEFEGITIEEVEYINQLNRKQKEFEKKYNIMTSSDKDGGKKKKNN